MLQKFAFLVAVWLNNKQYGAYSVPCIVRSTLQILTYFVLQQSCKVKIIFFLFMMKLNVFYKLTQ